MGHLLMPVALTLQGYHYMYQSTGIILKNLVPEIIPSLTYVDLPLLGIRQRRREGVKT